MQMFHIITQGILFGLTLALMVGPAFFSLLQTSISEGFRGGSHLAFGISLSDILMVFIAYYGLSAVFETNRAQRVVSIVGGVVIIGFGIYTFLHRHIPKAERPLVNVSKFKVKFMLKGFIFNIANPGTWLYWLIPIGVANSYAKRSEQIVFLASILLTNLGMDLLKCAISNELKNFLTDNVITIINRVVGVILACFGIYLIFSSFIPQADNLINNISH
jgi:threonine/homoserine/homoserine lactone efflux protein